MKLVILFITAIITFTIAPCKVGANHQKTQAGSAQEEKKQQPGKEIFVKNMGGEFNKRHSNMKQEMVQLAADALAERKGLNLQRNSDLLALASMFPAVTGFMCISNAFWKDDVFQEKTYISYVARIRLVPKDVEEEWNTILSKAESSGSDLFDQGEARKLQPMYTIASIIMQDRLFDANGFKPDEAKKLLARLNSIPPDVIVKWAEARLLDKYQAAISIINIDSLFIKEAFRKELFTKRLREVTTN